MKKLYILLIALTWLSSSKAIFAFGITTNKLTHTKDYTKIYDLILDLQLLQADSLLQHVPSQNQTPTFFVLRSQCDMLHVLLKDDKKLYKTYQKRESYYLQNLEQFNQKNNIFYHEYKWSKAEILLHWAAVKLSFDEKWSATWAIRDAYKLLLECEKEFPNEVLHKKSLGILQIVLGSAPEKYHWALNLIGLDADAKQGLKNLEESCTQHHFFKVEATLWRILLDVYLLEQQGVAKKNIQILCQKYPYKRLLLLVHSLVMMKNESHYLSLFLLKNYEKQSYVSVFTTYAVFKYVYAELLFYSLDYKHAQHYYLSFLQERINTQNFVKDSYYKLFLIAWFEDAGLNITENKYFQKIKDKGSSITAVDKQAANFTKQAVFPPQRLHYARMLTDGGNYKQAWQCLQGLSVASIHDKKYQLEYNYRQARILDKLGKSEEATLYYQTVIDKGKNEPYYFAANSALLLGYYFQKSNAKKARYYFELAISMKNHEYEESITQKAKLALRE